MSSKLDIQLLFKKVDLEAFGRRIAKSLLDFLSRPEILKLIVAIQDQARKNNKDQYEPEKKHRRGCFSLHEGSSNNIE